MSIVRRFLSRLPMSTTKPYLTIVVALDDCNGIGRDNQIPWHIKNDLKFFRYVTSEVKDPKKQNALIVGRKTYETFPKPLPNRLSLVISRNPTLANMHYDNVVRADDFDDAVKYANNEESVENIFVIGGVTVYEAAMNSNLVKRLFVTRVKGDYQCTAVWSSFDVSKFQRRENIPQEYQTFFDQKENETPACHLEMYEREF